ncbi:unnamed protein product, partial [marine sediment metagenome]
KDPELADEVPADTNYGILDYPFRLIRYVLGKMFSIDSSLILNKGYFVTRPGTRGIFQAYRGSPNSHVCRSTRGCIYVQYPLHVAELLTIPLHFGQRLRPA